MSWVLENSTATGTNHHVLLIIAQRYNEDAGYCFPSLDRIAFEAGRISRRTAQRAVRELVELGELEIVEGGGRHQTNHYKLPKYKGRQFDTLLSETVTSTTETVTNRARNGDTHVTPTVSNRKNNLRLILEEEINNPIREERPKDEVWEVLLEVSGITGTITKPERGKYNAATKALRAVGATPDQIRSVAQNYKTKYPGAPLTPSAIASHWGELSGKTRRPTSPEAFATGNY